MTASASLPDGFNPETNMIARDVDGRTYHCIIPAVRWASFLVANGDIAQAEKTIDAVLDCQETHPNDPHCGNFLWEREDDVVEDLNAVQFVLFNLIPMMVEHQDRLSSETQAKVLEGIRLGLDEIKRIDVGLGYTNIVLKDITNTCLGGELLNDSTIAERGYDKLAAWMEHTNANGIPTEFNSPNYAFIAIDVLSTLARLVKHADSQIQARVMVNRLGLSTALHIHTGTGRLAGPFSRAYRPTVYVETPPEIEGVQDWVKNGDLPDWIDDVLNHRPDTMQIIETADKVQGVGISTYHSPSYVLGVASQELTTQSNRFIALQSNVLIGHYTVPGQEQAGVFFSRYILNDKWLGDYRTTPSRETDQLLPEEGLFFGVQNGSRAIGVYAPRGLDAWSRCHSAKAVLVWLQRDSVDEIWIDDQQVETLPAVVAPGQVVVVASGDALFAARPFALTDLGRNAPVQLTTINDHLVLEMFNYKGSAKTFWEMAQPGSFYQGQPQCGFYVEVAERSDYANAAEFADVVASGTFTDEAEPRVTYSPGREHLWQLGYERDEKALGIEVDLMAWELKRRWNQASELDWPKLESPIVRHTASGTVRVGEATLTCSQNPAWLLAIPERKRWVVSYQGLEPSPITLTIPGGKVEIEAMGTGMIDWHDGEVRIETNHLEGTPIVSGGQLI